MRITPIQKHIICEAAEKHFGPDVHIWLFGSRVNDQAKGGDIDLYIEPSIQNVADLVMAKLQFLRDLHKKMGEQKIDVVLRRPNSSLNLSVYQIAKKTGIMLQ
jgi:predicted nucleotidyltransferase